MDPAFDDVRKDYHSSRTLANQMLEGSYEDRRVVGANGLGYLLNDKSPKYENGEPVYLKDKAQQQMEFYRDGKLAGNAAQRRRYLNDVQNGYTKKLGYENADGSMAPPHAYDIEQCLQKSIERAEKYCSDLEKLKLAAQEMLNAMNEARLGGREGSDQYKAMYDALEKVTRLSSDNTPSEVEQALDDVRSTAGDYKQKIDDLGIFAKFRQKGKDRYGFATGLEEFGRDKLIAFSGTSHLRLDLNEKVKDQLNRAKMNQLAYDAKQLKQVVQEKQPQEAALRQQAEREYLETVKAAEESLSGMGKGIKKPEGGLWEEKLDAFVKVATAKEIERRGGLKEGETILTVQKQLFGEKETRDAMTQMVKDYGGKKLIELAGKKEFGNLLKTYQEKRKTVNKEAPEKKANQLEKVEEPRKRSKSVTQKMDKHN